MDRIRPKNLVIVALGALLLTSGCPKPTGDTAAKNEADAKTPVMEHESALASIAAYEKAKTLAGQGELSVIQLHSARQAMIQAWNKLMPIHRAEVTDMMGRAQGKVYDWEKDTITTSDGELTLAAYEAKVTALKTDVEGRSATTTVGARYTFKQIEAGNGWHDATLEPTWDHQVVDPTKITKGSKLPQEFAKYEPDLRAKCLAVAEKRGGTNLEIISIEMATGESKVHNPEMKKPWRASPVDVYISGDFTHFEFAYGDAAARFVRYKEE